MAVNTRKMAVLMLFGIVLCLTGTTGADTIYDNGPINATDRGWALFDGYSETDSFTAPAASFTQSDITSASVGLWVEPGDTPQYVSWQIGTTPFGSDVASGTVASLTNTFLGSIIGPLSYDAYQSTFALPDVIISKNTTYYFTLLNGSGTLDSLLAWEVNYGPSTAYVNFNSLQIGSEEFTLYGIADVPEIDANSAASALTVLGCGVAMFRSRRKHAA